jgi:hypothetical protein
MIDASQVSVANLVTTAPLPCLLCGRRPAPWGCLFTPSDPQRFGAPRGKVRLIRYSLCGRCYRLPDRAKRAEARIRADLHGPPCARVAVAGR